MIWQTVWLLAKQSVLQLCRMKVKCFTSMLLTNKQASVFVQYTHVHDGCFFQTRITSKQRGNSHNASPQTKDTVAVSIVLHIARENANVFINTCVSLLKCCALEPLWKMRTMLLWKELGNFVFSTFEKLMPTVYKGFILRRKKGKKSFHVIRPSRYCSSLTNQCNQCVLQFGITSRQSWSLCNRSGGAGGVLSFLAFNSNWPSCTCKLHWLLLHIGI